MKRNKIIYWIATSLLSLGLASAGLTYLVTHRLDYAFRHFGFPDYFRVELGVAKILAALALTLPLVPLKVKGWAYVGVFIVFVSAFIAHLSVDGMATTPQPLFALCLWAVSAFSFNRINSGVLKPDNL